MDNMSDWFVRRRVLAALSIAAGFMVFADRAGAQAISPSAGCTAANAGTYDVSTDEANVAVNGDFTDSFVAGEVLTFMTATTPAGGGFTTATVDDATAGVSVLDTTAETSVDYTIPATGGRDFAVVLETTNDFPDGAIALSCAPAQGDISIVKESDVDGDFDFTGDLGDFTITVGGEPGINGFSNVNAGSYTISEVLDPAFTLENISCAGDDDNGSVIDVADAEVVIDLDAGENIQCTFTNATAPPPDPPSGSITIVKESDVDGNFDFTGDLGAFTISVAGEPGSQTFSELIPGVFNVSELVAEGFDLAGIACAGDDDNGSTVDLEAGSAAIDLDEGEAITCTFTNLEIPETAPETSLAAVKLASEHAIRTFLYRRASALLNEEADAPRILRRQPGALWRDATELSLTANENGVSGDFAASTNGAIGRRFDFWVEGHYSNYRYENEGVTEGDFGIVYLGADLFLSENVLIGALGQFDWASEMSSAAGETIDGDGWMVGPYISARLNDGFYFDGRAAWGQSNNSLAIEGLVADDEFETSRWLLRGAFTGNHQFGSFRITPTASVTYFEETQDVYLSATGASIDEQSITLGRAVFEPELAWRHELESGVVIEPQITLAGVWDFERPENLSIPGWTVTADEFRLRADAGFLVSFPNGWGVRASGSYDGVASENYRAYSARVWLDIPFGIAPRARRDAPDGPQLKTCADGTMIALSDACAAPTPETLQATVAFKPGKAALTADGQAALATAWGEASAYDVAAIRIDPATTDRKLAEQRVAAIKAALEALGAPADTVAAMIGPSAGDDAAAVIFELE